MEKKKKKIDKTKFKEILFKIIHGISYFCTFGFVAMILIVAVQGCSNKKTANVQSENQVQEIKRDLKPNRLPFDDIGDYQPYQWKSNLNVNSNLYVDQTYPRNLSAGIYEPSMLYDGDCYVLSYDSVHHLTIIFARYEIEEVSQGVNNVYLRNIYVRVYNDDTLTSFRTIEVMNFSISNPSGNKNFVQYGYDLSTLYFTQKLEVSNRGNSLNSSLIFSSLSLSIKNFSFNSDINYNAPFHATIKQPYVVKTDSVSGVYIYEFDTGYFISGGRLFNKIKMYFYDANGTTFLLPDSNTKITIDNSLYRYYAFMSYYNTNINTEVVVNERNRSAYETSNGGLSYYQDNSSSWVSSNYRYIKILNSNETLITDLGILNNNTYQYNNGVDDTNIGLNNVFSLLSLGFGSILNLLSIQILPGLTIGILIFLPLIVTIIILVFKVVKK